MLLGEGDLKTLLQEAHDAQLTRLANKAATTSAPITSFSKAAKAASLASVGEVGKSCKTAFTYGMENDPEVAA